MTVQSMTCVGERKCTDMAAGERRRLKCVANLDVNDISKDLFVQFVGDGCLVEKARDKPDLVSQLYIVPSRTILGHVQILVLELELAGGRVLSTFDWQFQQFDLRSWNCQNCHAPVAASEHAVKLPSRLLHHRNHQ